jgi:hypothetical protein
MNENTSGSTNQTAPKVFDFIDGNTLMAQEYEPLQFAVEKILPHGVFILAGSGKIGKARFASLRGTHGSFRGDCSGSDKRFGFYMGASAPSDRPYIFESPIDAMSHASLVNANTGDTGAWKRDNRLSLSGTSDVVLDFFFESAKRR